MRGWAGGVEGWRIHCRKRDQAASTTLKAPYFLPWGSRVPVCRNSWLCRTLLVLGVWGRLSWSLYSMQPTYHAHCCPSNLFKKGTCLFIVKDCPQEGQPSEEVSLPASPHRLHGSCLVSAGRITASGPVLDNLSGQVAAVPGIQWTVSTYPRKSNSPSMVFLSLYLPGPSLYDNGIRMD